MQVSAKLKNLRVSPRKVRLVADTVRGKDLQAAKIQLQFSTKKSSKIILDLLNSAVANAKNNFNLDEENLFVSDIFVNEGPTLKRWRPRAMGRAAAIRKRTCIVEVFVDDRNKSGKNEAVKVQDIKDDKIDKNAKEKNGEENKDKKLDEKVDDKKQDKNGKKINSKLRK